MLAFDFQTSCIVSIVESIIGTVHAHTCQHAMAIDQLHQCLLEYISVCLDHVVLPFAGF